MNFNNNPNMLFDLDNKLNQQNTEKNKTENNNENLSNTKNVKIIFLIKK